MTVEKVKRTVPISDLDLQAQLIRPQWGANTVNPELKAQLREMLSSAKVADGSTEITYKDYWSLLAYYTQDVRLGNLSTLGGEMEYCRERLDFAGECLQLGALNSFVTVLREAISVIELSQSKGGFLRRRGTTITSEEFKHGSDESKNKLFGKFQNASEGRPK